MKEGNDHQLKKALDCYTNSHSQHLRKCKENCMESMVYLGHTLVAWPLWHSGCCDVKVNVLSLLFTPHHYRLVFAETV